MSELSARPDSPPQHSRAHNGLAPDPEEAARLERIESLVPGWYTVPELAEVQSLKPGEARRQIEDGELLSVRRGPNHAVHVPASFIAEGAPLPRLKGTFTVLKDGGMHDSEIIEWLFTPDGTLPTGGTPMDAFRAGHVTEVRRRAMETAL